MSRFVTVDLNGWLDHLVDENGAVRTLGFRSCLYRHENTWLFGAQALAAARDAGTNQPLVDGADALDRAAGQGTHPSEEHDALPAALWQLAADAARRSPSGGPVHLALVIPDDRYLGSALVGKDTGKTALETLHESIERSRPRALTGSRVELVWRSVAALKAVMNQGRLGDAPGAVLVISVNRKGIIYLSNRNGGPLNRVQP